MSKITIDNQLEDEAIEEVWKELCQKHPCICNSVSKVFFRFGWIYGTMFYLRKEMEKARKASDSLRRTIQLIQKDTN